MTIYFRSAIFLGLYLSLFSCSKENVSPESEESQRVEPVYELIEIKYSMMEGDGVDTATVKLPDVELSNAGNATTQQDIKVNYDELVKKSLFVIDSVDVFPDGLVLDTFKVNVPSDWYDDDSYSLYSAVFPLTIEEQEAPYVQSVEDVLTVKIPPISRVVITTEIDAYNLKCSFHAIFKDQITGKQDTINGRWNGTMRYNNSSIEVREFPL